MYYPIYIKKDGSDFRIPKLKWSDKTQEYEILEPCNNDEIISYPIDEYGRERRWKWSLERALANKGEMTIKLDRDKNYAVYIKSRMKEEGMLPLTVWDEKQYSSTEYGTNLLNNLFKKRLFDYPKSLYAVMDCLRVATENKNALILDFFSGSATTAHAVMQLNAEDGGKRKFIMVQLPEKCDEKSEAYKAGYKNICEIGKARIRRAGKKIQENIKFYKPIEDYITEEERESGKATIAKTASNGTSGLIDEIESGTETFIDLVTKERTTKEYSKSNPKDHYRFYPDDLDIGFRVLKLDSSNMKDVYYRPEQYRQSLLEDLGDNIKEDRTPLDLLFQVMLELGKPLSAKIEEKDICGKHVFIVDENDLIACFDANVTAETVKAIALLKPLYAVFRDSSLADDAVGSNFDQIFATYSPNTTRRVL